MATLEPTLARVGTGRAVRELQRQPARANTAAWRSGAHSGLSPAKRTEPSHHVACMTMPCSRRRITTLTALLLVLLAQCQAAESATAPDASIASPVEQLAPKAHQHEFVGVVVHVFIINLRKQRKRLSETVRKLSQQELPRGWEVSIHRVEPHTIKDAEHGQHVYPHWVMSKAEVLKMPPSPGSVLNEMSFYWSAAITTGEVACFMSHMKAARLVLDVPPEMPSAPPAPGMPDGPRPKQIFLVLEDDINIDDPRASYADPVIRHPTHSQGTRNMFTMIQKIHDEVAEHDPEWHYVSLGRAELDRNSEPLSAQSRYVSKPGFFYQTQAQLLSRAGAAKMLSRNTSHNIIAYDEWLNAAGGFHPRADLNALYFDEKEPLRVYASTNAFFIKQYAFMDHDTIPGLLPEKQGTDALGPDAVQSYVESLRMLLFDVGEDNVAKRRSAAAHLGSRNTSAVASLSVDQLCSSVFVLGAGSDEFDGRYEYQDPATREYMFVQQSDGDEKKLGPGMHREMFITANADFVNVWWNLQQRRSPPLVDKEVWDPPMYGAWALPVALPPTTGWSSQLSTAQWKGLAPMPVVLSPAGLFGARCASTAVQGFEGFARSQSGVVSGRGEDSAAVPPRVHFFTINAAAKGGVVLSKSVREHLSAADQHGQAVQVFLGPWQDRITGKIKNAMWRMITAARPKDVLVFGGGFHTAWLCPSTDIEKVLRRSGRPILLSSGHSWLCSGCDATLRSLYENTFKADHGDGSGATPQYIDGAAWVGEAWALRLFAEAVGKQGWMTRNGGTSDRAAWIEWAVENERMVAVDRAQELAMTIGGGLSNHCTVSRTTAM